ncbi:hypothetical protein OAO01_08125 [Oligoflexia bacterium]|nr:hypothetical protein [Oligoflexia bacterium]
MAKIFQTLALILLIVFTHATTYADIQDPFDPFDVPLGEMIDEKYDKHKSATELIHEAELLFMDERPLAARTKLLLALKKEPKHFEAHKLLAGYYLVHVGHYRLALKYIKRAQELFVAQNGQPPYKSILTQNQHSHLLQLLSQIRLNLDNYQGALDVLEQYAAHGYYQSWFPGSKAWILMKLGRMQEAVTVAKLGIVAGAEPGRTLNILGILLSMTGERVASLQTFMEAISYELSLGRIGQPATPLNNSGEVYREIYQEDKAERSWLKATSLPDGCEHVLPALNLALLYNEQTKYAAAKKAIDNFEGCVAQFPLRNGEEHKAFVHLARGRIALHTGNATSATDHLEKTLQRRQWFGKIGASQDDLIAASSISLAQALQAQNSYEKFYRHSDWSSKVRSVKTRIHNKLRIWWLRRRARQILSEDLSGIEDLFIRHTDSVIEYQSFGSVLADFPVSVLHKRIEMEKERDKRIESWVYYNAYLAENYLVHGKKQKALEYINKAMQGTRNKYDDALMVHVLSLKLKLFEEDSLDYTKLATALFAQSPAALRNYGLRLPAFFDISEKDVVRELGKSAFTAVKQEKPEFVIDYAFEDGKHVLAFSSRSDLIRNVRVLGEDLQDVINQLNDEVFRVKL